jgi:starch synthase
MYDVIGWAVSTYYDRPMHVEGMRRRAMVKDFSWEKAAGSYEEVYGQALRLGSFRKAG